MFNANMFTKCTIQLHLSSNKLQKFESIRCIRGRLHEFMSIMKKWPLAVLGKTKRKPDPSIESRIKTLCPLFTWSNLSRKFFMRRPATAPPVGLRSFMLAFCVN
jgi:hypothetical protein